MQNRGQVFVGVFLVLLGVVFLITNVLRINIWTLCWPLGLIVLGVLLFLRPQAFGSSAAGGVHLIGDVHRHGEWAVTNEEFWIGIGNVNLDVTQARIPAGVTTIRVVGLIGDVDILAPYDVGLAVTANAFVADVTLQARKEQRFLSTLRMTSDNYAAAERKLHLETTFCVGDIKIKQV